MTSKGKAEAVVHVVCSRAWWVMLLLLSITISFFVVQKRFFIEKGKLLKDGSA